MIFNPKIGTRLLAATVAAIITLQANAFASDEELGITNAELREMTALYVREPASAQVAYWKTLMPAGSNKTSRQRAALAGLPSQWTKHQLRDTRLTERLLKIINPVTDIYGKSYEIVVLEFNKPVLIVDSDALLIFSTELLKRLRSEDELLGLIAHEVAHSLFLEKSAALKPLLTDKTCRASAIKYLALIELSCDAIAVRTLLALNRDPLAFLRFISTIERDYLPSRDGSPFYPSISLRLRQASTVSTSAGDSTPRLPKSFKPVALSLLK